MRRKHWGHILLLSAVALWVMATTWVDHGAFAMAELDNASFLQNDCFCTRQASLPPLAFQEIPYPGHGRSVLTRDSYDDAVDLAPVGAISPALTDTIFHHVSPEASVRTLKDYQSLLNIRRE